MAGIVGCVAALFIVASSLYAWSNTRAWGGRRIYTYDTSEQFDSYYYDPFVDVPVSPVVAVVIAAAIGALMVWLVRVALDR